MTPLLAAPRVASALAADVTASVRALLPPRLISLSATATAPHGRAFSTIHAVITGAARSCAAADDALVGGLAAGVQAVCAPCGRTLAGWPPPTPGTPTLARWTRCSFGCDAALRHPTAVVERDLAGCDGGANACPSGGDNAYNAAREQVARLAANGAVLRWWVEAERMTGVGTLARHARMAANDRELPLEGLPVWAAMAQRQLLAAAPDVLQQLLGAAGDVAATRPAALYPHLLKSMMELQHLAHIDPPRLRALPQVPRVLASAATYMAGARSLARGSPSNDGTVVLFPLLALYAPGHGAAMADCEKLLTRRARGEL